LSVNDTINGMAKLHVGVVIHGCPEQVAPCLDSLLKSELDFPAHFIFLDNGSPEQAGIGPILESAKAQYPDSVEIHKSEQNKGCAGGWNFCIRKAQADPEFEWMVLAGHDIVVHPKALKNLILRYLKGGIDLASGVDVGWEQPMPEIKSEEVPGANFSFLLVPRTVIEKVGLFDENIWPAYFEDNDFHFRCYLAGCGRGVWTWTAPFRHFRSSTVRTYPNVSQHFASNTKYFTQKWGGLPAEVIDKNPSLRKAIEDYHREFDERKKLELKDSNKGKMYLYLPVMDLKPLTLECVQHLNDTVVDRENFKLVIVDNVSDPPYSLDDFQEISLDIEILRNEKNWGMFYPLIQLHEKYPVTDDDIIGTLHNDVFVYEQGWDTRVREAFKIDPLLGLVGFCGSGEVDELGGRGGDTKCFFDGRRGQKQENTGRRIEHLEPAVIVDSLAMFFRRSMVEKLRITINDPLYHFWDKVLPLRLVDIGLHVAVLGIQIDHLGGQTAVGNASRFEPHALEWCKEQGVDFGPSINGGAGMYLEAEKRMFEEMAPKGLIPCRINSGYGLHRVFDKAVFPWQMKGEKR